MTILQSFATDVSNRCKYPNAIVLDESCFILDSFLALTWNTIALKKISSHFAAWYCLSQNRRLGNDPWNSMLMTYVVLLSAGWPDTYSVSARTRSLKLVAVDEVFLVKYLDHFVWSYIEIKQIFLDKWTLTSYLELNLNFQIQGFLGDGNILILFLTMTTATSLLKNLHNSLWIRRLDEDVIFQKRVRVLHKVSKQRETDESQRPHLIEHEARVFEMTSQLRIIVVIQLGVLAHF